MSFGDKFNSGRGKGAGELLLITAVCRGLSSGCGYLLFMETRRGGDCFGALGGSKV